MKKISEMKTKDLDDALIQLSRETSSPMKIEMVFPSIRAAMNDYQKQLCIKKLINDGYAEISFKHMGYDSNGNEKRDQFHKFYCITYDGLMFIKKGGYRKAELNDRIKTYLQTSNAIIVAMATIFAAWYAAFEIWKYYYGYVPPIK